MKKFLYILPVVALGFLYSGNADALVDSTVEINSSTSNGPSLNDEDYYGGSIANIGDLNGDGVQDIAVGAYLDDEGGSWRGAIYIHYLNTDGSIKSTVEINGSTVNGPVLNDVDKYGSSIANIGDLNGDGVSDIAVGAFRDDGGGVVRGAVHIHFLNTDGSIKSTVEINGSTTNGPILEDMDFYGKSIANIGDLNGDGVQDIAVGAFGDGEGGSWQGAVHIHFMNRDGSIDSTAEINSSTVNGPTLDDYDYYGSSIANVGDLDGDGVQDIAVGAYGDEGSGKNRGVVYIHYLKTDGSVKSTVEINGSTVNGPTLSDFDKYGASIASMGDLNNDGVGDIVVGARGDDNKGNQSVYIHYMNADGSIIATIEINSSTVNGPNFDDSDRYGGSIVNIGDLNNDGVEDIAVGAYKDDEGGVNRGAVHIHFMSGIV